VRTREWTHPGTEQKWRRRINKGRGLTARELGEEGAVPDVVVVVVVVSARALLRPAHEAAQGNKALASRTRRPTTHKRQTLAPQAGGEQGGQPRHCVGALVAHAPRVAMAAAPRLHLPEDVRRVVMHRRGGEGRRQWGAKQGGGGGNLATRTTAVLQVLRRAR
jgi:hypothetical protein